MRVFLQLLLLLFLAGCGQNIQETEFRTHVDAPVIYPKIRIWNTPSAGEIPDFNPPAFQWPSVKKATYGIRISSSRDFDEDLIEAEALSFAIFNPHQALKDGKWYWQYRVNDGDWNQPDSFMISKETQLFITPEIDVILEGIRGSGHPRVLVRKGELEAFRVQAKQPAESVKILTEANGFVGKQPPKETDALPTYSGKDDFENKKIALLASKWVGWHFYHTMDILSQAYVLTGDRKYFETARSWMLEAADWDPRGPTHTNNFGDSGIMAGLALGVDTFWDLLSADERDRIISQAATRAQQFYELWLNQVESRSSSMHVWQHILHRMFYTSLALIGERREAENWLEYIYELWIAQSPKMGPPDGAWFNGVSYFEMNTLTLYDVNAMLSEITGADFMVSPWYQNNARWLIYAFPPGSVADGFCNNGSLYQQPTLNYAGYANAVAGKFKDPYASWYANEISRIHGEEIADDEEFRWYRIKRGHLDPSPAPPKTFDLPQASWFPDVGVAYMHTALQDAGSNLMLSVRSSPFGPMAHTHADQNTFNIAYGGKRLFYNTGYRPAMGDPHFLGWYKHTQGHNGVLINGKGQPFVDGSYGWIPRFLHGKQVSYAVGDASMAYGDSEIKLKTFRRHYLMLRPSILVIYDELEAESGTEWAWLLHNDLGFKIDGNELWAESEVAQAKVSLFSSSRVQFQLTDQFSVPVENWTNKVDEEGDTLAFENQWHFKAVSEEKVERMRFLAIFQIRPDGAFEPVKRSGDTFEVGSWIIEAHMDTSRQGAVMIRNTDQTVAFSSLGMLEIQGKDFSKEQSASAKLYEWNDGKELYLEASDSIPAAIQNVLGKSPAFPNYKISRF